jgi:hypothetical protein
MMHHCRAAKADLNEDLVAAVSERAFTVVPGGFSDFADEGTRPKRASTASRCAASPRPKRRMTGAYSPATTSVCHSPGRRSPHSRSSSDPVGAR